MITLLKGTVMGIVETIPGVSGGTLALIMGIYDEFINLLYSLSNLAKTFFKLVFKKASVLEFLSAVTSVSYGFGAKLFFGMFLGIVVFSHLLSFALDSFPALTFAFFFGLIAGSLLVPWKEIEEFSPQVFLGLVASVLIFYYVLGLKPLDVVDPSPILIFTGGFLAVCAMILPGVSGSFILLLLGLYEHVINTVKDITTFNFGIGEITDLFVLFLGILGGFLIFIRILKIALNKSRSLIMAVLMGLMAASLRNLWPFVDQTSADKFENMAKVSPGALPEDQVLLISAVLVTTTVVTFIANQKLSSASSEAGEVLEGEVVT